MAEQGPLSGQTLGGRYLLGDLLGEGGFGVVYASRHLLLDRPQAIKVLLEQHFRKPKFRERFLREARTVAALDHPHIVHIDDFGMEEQTSQAYLVMPFVGGGTFHDLLRKRREPLTLEQTVSYLEQVCNALDYAHQRGVVHLDLKPHNLLVHEDGRLLLSDFGLAHLLKQEGLKGGSSLGYGTPPYMAPEHIQEKPEKCSDVYALGVILYQMLVGHCPFEGSIENVIRQHLMTPPPPLRASRPELPMELEEVLKKALAKEVAERYRSAGELLTAFKTALARAQERIRKAEEERLQRIEAERARKAEKERVRKAQEEQARRAEEERIRQVQQFQQKEPVPIRASGAASPPQKRPSSLREEVEKFFRGIIVLLLLTDLFIPGPAFLLLGILGFFHVSILSGLNIDLVHRLVCLAVGLVGSILIVVSYRGAKMWPWIGYNFIVGLACLTVGIGGLVNRSFYSSYPLLSLTHVNVVDSILGLVIGILATLGLVAYVVVELLR